MRGPDRSRQRIEDDLKALDRRAEKILRARPAYKEMVDFYLTVFRRQIEWRDRLVVHPEPVEGEQLRRTLSAGRPLIEEFDPGIESSSLEDLWTEMKAVFRRGNPVLGQGPVLGVEQVAQQVIPVHVTLQGRRSGVRFDQMLIEPPLGNLQRGPPQGIVGHNRICDSGR